MEIIVGTLAQVIADFDATLTRYWIDGRRGQSKIDGCGNVLLKL